MLLLHFFWALEFFHFETETNPWDLVVAVVLMVGPFALEGLRAAREDPEASGAMVKYLVAGVALAPLLWVIMAVVVIAWAAANNQIRM